MQRIGVFRGERRESWRDRRIWRQRTAWSGTTRPKSVAQTPYRYFPIEPHWLFPGLQFLPQRARASVIRCWPLSPAWLNPEQALQDILEVELFSKTEMKYYFPSSEVLNERAPEPDEIDHRRRPPVNPDCCTISYAQPFQNDARIADRWGPLGASPASPEDAINRKEKGDAY